jgi:3-oxoacyl-[acyl-carrier-protein] synthase-1
MVTATKRHRGHVSPVVTGLGMVSSVGWDALSACAAIRAGLTRPQEAGHFRVLDEEENESVPVLGHPVSGYTDGFNLTGCWIRLASGAFADLLSSAGLPDTQSVSFWSRTTFLAVTPYSNHPRFDDEDGDGVEGLTEGYLLPLLEALGLAVGLASAQVVAFEHAGTAVAIDLALDLLADRRADRVVIVAADSYLDPLTLKWLVSLGRLKTADFPVGLAPGECGACVLLEREDVAERRGAIGLARLSASTLAKEENHYFSEGTNAGGALANCIQAALTDVGTVPFAGDVFSDLNGEAWRAAEWGYAQVRLSNWLRADHRLHLPATSVGDTGAASGAVGICSAVHAFRRRCAKTETAIVLSSSDRGDVGCVVVGAMGGTGRRP